MKTYQSKSPALCTSPKLVGRIAGGLLLGILFMVGVLVACWSTDQPGQALPVGMLRTLNTAEITYRASYGNSYSPSLAELAPPAKGMQPTSSAAGLIDSELASGTRKGYRFEYKPGPPDEHGRITSYTICAKPVDKAGPPSRYFTDETGVIRTTTEDRCPNASDFAVAG